MSTDRWHEIANDRHSEALARMVEEYQPERVTGADRDMAERFEKWDAQRRAVEAARLLKEDKLEDDSLWTRAPLHPGEWHMKEQQVPDYDERGRWATTKTVQTWWKEHPKKTPVAGSYLDWLVTGRKQLDPGYVEDAAAWKPTLHTQQDRDEWAQATEDDYQGGPVEWDAHTDHYDLSA